jgi:iron complex outermembrane receptor protein
MNAHTTLLRSAALLLFLVTVSAWCFGQQASGTLKGKVTYETGGTPAHNASILLMPSGRTCMADEKGEFDFQKVPPGQYKVLVHVEGFPDTVEEVRIKAGETTNTELQLKLSPIREEVTVTATGQEQTTFEAFQSVISLDSVQLTDKLTTSIGEALENERGVAKRSFGPGSSRPVIRGFDGDRVLVLQDGMRTGSLGSQSGDHGETIEVLNLERLEVVKGPATLLYGSNAIGGVVNAVTGRAEVPDKPASGTRGYFTGVGSTNNKNAGFGAGLDYGVGNWLLWLDGGAQRTSDYNSPLGRVVNSRTRSGEISGGGGYYANKGFFTANYGYEKRRYGVPFAALFEGGGVVDPAVELEEISINMRRHNVRLTGGVRNLDSFINAFKMTFDYSNYQHQELEGETVGTTFNNKQFAYRGVFEQQRRGSLSGSFGFWGLHRDYETIGAETLAPPVVQNAFAVFGLQELDFERVKFQFGGRIETNRYNPESLVRRTFTGFSGAAGVRVPLWNGGAFVFNYTHSFRAPSLEELYNNGPHIGNLTFEVGNPDLVGERSNGVDFSVRHSSKRVRAEANFYRYSLKNFVFLAPRDADGDGVLDREDGLIIADYLQANSRFIGTELGFDWELYPNLWLLTGFDAVDAELRDTGTPLPRIPPMRGRLGLDWRYKGFSVRPEAILVRDQDQIFPTETRTAGYALFNLRGSYTIPRPHYMQIFSVNAFNLGDRLYRNHLSFIKDLAPEIGRGVRFTYTIRWF